MTKLTLKNVKWVIEFWAAIILGYKGLVISI